VFEVMPIGVAHTPFREKVQAPRQAVAAPGVKGTIELLPEYEHALADLAGIERIWVIYWFHLVKGWRARVLPPRSERRRGLFATRSPHRPSPIGLSCVRLARVDGRVLHIEDVDMVDGTPVLDIKPYVPYADAFPESRTGWLEAPDPIPRYDVRWSDEARTQAAWLRKRGLEIAAPVEEILALGPQPHPYRRIREDGEGLRLAYKEWRVRFHVEEPRAIVIDRVTSGYRPSQIHAEDAPAALAVHRAFVALFQL
jgi:tRNA-Thr(GGU) m(6)t(6)A37 methyltransferase TsaA